jgi:hypothetical protein
VAGQGPASRAITTILRPIVDRINSRSGFGMTDPSAAARRCWLDSRLENVRCLTRLDLSNEDAKVLTMNSAQELPELPCQTY